MLNIYTNTVFLFILRYNITYHTNATQLNSGVYIEDYSPRSTPQNYNASVNVGISSVPSASMSFGWNACDLTIKNHSNTSSAQKVNIEYDYRDSEYARGETRQQAAVIYYTGKSSVMVQSNANVIVRERYMSRTTTMYLTDSYKTFSFNGKYK